MKANTNNLKNMCANKLNLSWNNLDNVDYYERIPIEALRKFAIDGGFENGSDVDVIFPLIKNTSTILDLGAGYGRVIQNLLTRGYQGKIYAIERSLNLYNYLMKNFAGRAEIFHADINAIELIKKFDVITWMWANISEFPKQDQPIVLKRIFKWLSHGGVFILDTIRHDIVTKPATHIDGQSYIADSNFGKAYGYLPSTDEIDQYAKSIGINSVTHINYTTTTGRPRIIHILKNN